MNPAFYACDHIWRNVHLATMNPDQPGDYGECYHQAIGVKDGRIAVMDDHHQYPTDCPVATTEGNGQWMTPGFIDCHTHLIYGGDRSREFAQRLAGASYEQIAHAGGGILSTVNATRQASVAQLVAQAQGRLRSLLFEGVTTVEIKSGYGLTLEDECKQLQAAQQLLAQYPCDGSFTLLAAHSLPPEFTHHQAYIDHICQVILPHVAKQGLAEAVDMFCEGIAFNTDHGKQLFTAAQRHGLGIKIHAEQLSNQQGATLASGFNAWSADHLEYLDDEGVTAMAAANTVAVLLPGAFYFLREQQLPPVAALRQQQVPMAIASDLNPGTSPLASLRLMMNMACVLFRLTPAEALAGVTRHAAQALNRQQSIGQIRTDMNADLLLWAIDHPDQLAAQWQIQPPKQRIYRGNVCDITL